MELIIQKIIEKISSSFEKDLKKPDNGKRRYFRVYSSHKEDVR
jgi:hypothetical protein